WTDSNMRLLLRNSVKWVTSPIIRPSIPDPAAVYMNNNIVVNLKNHEYDREEMTHTKLYNPVIANTTTNSDHNQERGIYITANRNMQITRVGWYADIPAQTLTARVYNAFWNTTSGRWERSKTGGVTDPPITTGTLATLGVSGYKWYDIPLSAPYTLQAGQDYDIAVQFGTTTAWQYRQDSYLPITINDVVIRDGELTGSASNSVHPALRIVGPDTGSGTYVSSLTPASSGTGDVTRGNSFTLAEDIVVRSLRHYFGVQYSIWYESNGTLIYTQPISGTPGQWTETPLDNPIVLRGGFRYTMGAWAGVGGPYHWGVAAIPQGANVGKLLDVRGRGVAGNAFPNSDFPNVYPIDIVYTWGSPDLKWWVSDYDSSAIKTINGQNGTADRLTFVPQENYHGTTQVTLRLTDSSGQSREHIMPLTWKFAGYGEVLVLKGSADESSAISAITAGGFRVVDGGLASAYTGAVDPGRY
ncbi:MAG: hypothetical protein QCI38_08655, partial [Candidatus Thermoplasmatota archaeon]|nr:hypothetical protein [Candidatus Thermoplasmatota archaeon]